MKASFAQFLSLRHGGSGFVFGYGSGLPGQNTTVLTATPQPERPGRSPTNPIPADRPFHSLSYPDINYTIMRPAALPPSTYTDPQPSTPPTPPIPNPFSATPYTRATATPATQACGTRTCTRASPRGTPPATTRRARRRPRDHSFAAARDPGPPAVPAARREPDRRPAKQRERDAATRTSNNRHAR